MGKTHERATAGVLRAEDASAGLISGVLATDGEASDGDILHIPGGSVEPGMPLLFGHDTLPLGDALRHLGSWTGFDKGSHEIRGSARIEVEAGEGASLEFRRDVAAMIDAGHINGLSIRWEPTEPPKRRINLPSDHYAFVDESSEKNPAKRYGYFYPKWRGLEGSVVTLGADQAALIGRCRWHAGPADEATERQRNENWWQVLKATMRDEIMGEPHAWERAAARLSADALAELLLERLDAGETIPDEILIRLSGGDVPSLDDEEPEHQPAPEPRPIQRAPSPSDIAQALRDAVEADHAAIQAALRRELVRLVGE